MQTNISIYKKSGKTVWFVEILVLRKKVRTNNRRSDLFLISLNSQTLLIVYFLKILIYFLKMLHHTHLYPSRDVSTLTNILKNVVNLWYYFFVPINKKYINIENSSFVRTTRDGFSQGSSG